MVTNLDDDNNDGKIDHLDTPEVIFISFDVSLKPGLEATNPYNYWLGYGVLRAVHGYDGSEFWSTDGSSATKVDGASSVAIGDIDGDNIPEIVAVRYNGGPIVFRNDGTVLWSCSDFGNCAPDSLNWGGPSLADLNHDGKSEIILGNYVYLHNGNLWWNASTVYGSGDNGVGPLSISADVNMDGSPDIVTGNTVYNYNGIIQWYDPSYDDGFPAVGNFDQDDYPEIVVASNGYLRMMEHDGSFIWEELLPGGGHGGAPTIADFDGDGESEIGVVGVTQYSVFEGNGTLLWSTPIQEFSSSRTGSAVFDFEGDGVAEVLYSDEIALRVYQYDTISNSVSMIWSTPNTTFTAYEYPVVADVDNDGNAEIVVVSNNFPNGNGNTGVRVFGDTQDNWVSTRTIWNQHTYHIDNIDQDAHIPQTEEYSWLSHNSYRLNAQNSSVSQFYAPDIQALDPVHLDLCPDKIWLGIWVHNGGAIHVPSGISVAVYVGVPSPTNPAIAFGATTQPLEPGRAEFVAIPWLNPSKFAQDVYLLVDDDGTGTGTGYHNECNETNNQAIIFSLSCSY